MRVRLFDITSQLGQYLLGLTISLLYFFTLTLSEASYANLQVPEGIYSNNIWFSSDCMSYLQPARNYIEHGVFGAGTIPDCFRTTGYPAFIALIIHVFGDKWLFATYIIQAFIFAGIYPALSGIISMLYPGNRSLIKWTFIVLLATGIFWTRVPYIGTDLFFTAFFLIGIFYGMRSVTRQSWGYLLFYLLFIGVAAQVRPTLSLYPALSLAFMAYIAKRNNMLKSSCTRRVLITSTSALLILCNLPALRNYMHHDFFKPSNVMERNLFMCLDLGVLKREQQMDRFIFLLHKVEKEQDVKKKMELEINITKEIVSEYPLTTAIVIFYDNMKDVWLGNHLINTISAYFNYSWKARGSISAFGSRQPPLKASLILYVANWAFMFFYLLVYCLFISFCLKLTRKKEWFFLLVIVLLIGLFMAPAIITGNSGSRFRLPVEPFIIIFSLKELQERIGKYKFLLIKRNSF